MRIALFLFSLCLFIPASSASHPSSDLLDIYQQVYCPECRGVTIDASESLHSQKLRLEVREAFSRGLSKTEIIHHLKKRYKGFVKVKESNNAFLIFMFFLSLIILFFTIRKLFYKK